jgi:hypothetical protein
VQRAFDDARVLSLIELANGTATGTASTSTSNTTSRPTQLQLSRLTVVKVPREAGHGRRGLGHDRRCRRRARLSDKQEVYSVGW